MYHGDVVPGFPAASAPRLRDGDDRPHRLHRSLRLARRDGALRQGRRAVADGRRRHRALGDVSAARTRPAEPARAVSDLAEPAGADKLVAPYFTMFWDQDIPRLRPARRRRAARSTITVIAGALGGLTAAGAAARLVGRAPRRRRRDLVDHARPRRVVDGAAGARRARPCARCTSSAARRSRSAIASCRARPPSRCTPIRPVPLAAADGPVEILLLQGRPIGEPVAQYGPFVMNTRAELEQAFQDYRRTQFGGWPFPENAPVHPRERGRFARHADGRVEEAGATAVAGRIAGLSRAQPGNARALAHLRGAPARAGARWCPSSSCRSPCPCR